MAMLISLVLLGASAKLFSACDASGDVISSFEFVSSSCASSDSIADWTVINGTLTGVTAGAGTNQAIDGNDYANLNWNLSPSGEISIIAVLNSAFMGTGSDWSASKYISMAYGVTNNATEGADSFLTDFDITTTANGFMQFEVPGSNLSSSAATLTSSEWIFDVISMSYAENVGANFSAVNTIGIEEDGNAPGFGTTSISLDYLSLKGTATAQPPIAPANITGTASCGGFTMSWTAPFPVGADDPIFGYHVYRAPTAGGPWTSVAYESLTVTSYNETNPIPLSVSSTEYFVVLPYSISSTAFGAGNLAMYAGCDIANLDPAWLPVDGGVNESLISAAVPKGFSAYGGCTPTYTPSLTPSSTYSATITPSPSYSPTSTITATSTPSPTKSPTITDSPTPPPPGSSNTDSPTNTPVVIPPTLTFTPTNTPVIPVFSPSDSPTPTISPLPAANNSTQLYPNPFYPDGPSNIFHLGNVSAGQTMTIYDMIGRLVYSKSLIGNPQVDTWDGSNNNGVKVGTGMYILVITGDGQPNQIYRVAVVRDAK